MLISAWDAINAGICANNWRMAVALPFHFAGVPEHVAMKDGTAEEEVEEDRLIDDVDSTFQRCKYCKYCLCFASGNLTMSHGALQSIQRLVFISWHLCASNETVKGSNSTSDPEFANTLNFDCSTAPLKPSNTVYSPGANASNQLNGSFKTQPNSPP